MISKKNMFGLLSVITALLLSMFITPAVAGAPGVFPDKIVIGSPADLQGPAAFVTNANFEGARVLFQKVYDDKVYPRKIEVIQEHGGYSPATVMKAGKLLIERDNVFIFFVTTGTSATLALNTILEKEKIPLVGMGCQAEVAAVPPKRYLFQHYTTYVDQAGIAVDYIIEKNGKDAKIAFFYQDDEFGYDGLRGFRARMKAYGIKPAAEASFKRGAIDVSSQAMKMKAAKPGWVIVHSLWGACGKLIKEAKKIGWKPQFMGISGTADAVILKLAGDAATYGKPFMGVVLNHPWDSDAWGAKEYRAAMKKYNPKAKLGTFSFWGYGMAKIVVEGLRRIKGEPTREKFIKALESFRGFDTGCFPPLTWKSNFRKGSKGGMIVVQKEGTFKPITGWKDVKVLK